MWRLRCLRIYNSVYVAKNKRILVSGLFECTIISVGKTGLWKFPLFSSTFDSRRINIQLCELRYLTLWRFNFVMCDTLSKTMQTTYSTTCELNWINFMKVLSFISYYSKSDNQGSTVYSDSFFDVSKAHA